MIGRERELASACELLSRDEIRLLSITGPGGVGKTRFALVLAEHARGEFAGGDAVVSLAALRDPGLVVSTVAHALGVRDADDPMGSVCAWLGSREFLLVLDNFEHLLSAAPAISELMVNCPAVTVLSTSRARLGLAGEFELSLGPLDVPALEPSPDPASLLAFASVALLVERARAVDPAFALGDANARAVAELCVRLDGLPLAIELAAGRMKLLSPEALLERLDRRLEVLAGGPRDVPARQQTLRSTIDWSYQLLDDAERRLFRRLSAFAGGATVAAAEAVGNAPGDLAAPLDVLASLIDKSMVFRLPQSDDEPRLGMLETVRDYATECLGEAERDCVQRAHVDWYLVLAERAEPAITAAEGRRTLARLEREVDNFRVAMLHALQRGQGDEALRLSGALWRFWFERGGVAEGQRWIERALQAAGSTPRTRAKALCGAGVLAHEQSDYTAAAEFSSQALSIYRDLGDTRGIAQALGGLALTARTQGRYDEACCLYEEALGVSRALDDRWLTAHLLERLGTAELWAGDDRHAERHLHEPCGFSRGWRPGVRGQRAQPVGGGDARQRRSSDGGAIH